MSEEPHCGPPARSCPGADKTDDETKAAHRVLLSKPLEPKLRASDPRKKLVRILTFGLDTVDWELHGLCADDGGGGLAAVGNDMLLKAMNRRGIQTVDIFTDVRKFHDPDSCHLR